MRSPQEVNAALIAFTDDCERAASLTGLETIWRARMDALGFSFAALGAHVDPLRPDRAGYLFHNYPAEWIEYYSLQRYHVIDPVYRSAEAGSTEFQWHDRDFVRRLTWRQRRILAEAREFGLHYGRTHSLASVRHLTASASLVAQHADIDPETYTAAKVANIVVHHRAAQLCAATLPPVPELKPRERQCLELCARGLSDADIARSIGVSAATVRRHIESARMRLGVSTRLLAAMKAIRSGQIEAWS